MEDKILLEHLNNYFLKTDTDIDSYIKHNEISLHDYKLLTLSLLSELLFECIPCYNYKKVINNIDNKDFMNDEENYL